MGSASCVGSCQVFSVAAAEGEPRSTDEMRLEGAQSFGT